ncbi:DUF3499 domain-containing protein [Schaalia sp. 19OD2882]|uniref:DUF3499 domain-containing protein n=1 Tax=Schaalia sp. 19OD2882 TaxID=2794089 RepID=UPI001C1E9B85|nr:DUF3499 domain-containing protein [Schaalia sp. 19OD2882]QWW20299.1 DUF3499 domain-containing protein [Schaalia sp. 19OD2882]
MIAARHCSKPGCSRSAVATLTYDYGASTAVLGPLATTAEPHTYDLCEVHAQTLTAPKGWQVVRLTTNFEPAPPSPDDLMALVDAVRRAADITAHDAQADMARATPTHPTPAPRAETRRSGSPEYGPFRRVNGEEAPLPGTDQEASAADATKSPLDPSSPWARRRSMFHVVADQDTDRVGALGQDAPDGD